MEILHLCSYYIGNKLYRNLFKALSREGVSQVISVPVKSSKLIGKNEIEHGENLIFHYENILTLSDKFLYKSKIKKQLKKIEERIDFNKDIDFVHAHTVFSDGGTAYLLHQKFGKKYIVNVRNTDINIFWKYGKHLRKFMIQILLKAEGIIFLSPAYMEETLKLLPDDIVEKVYFKCKVIPNGIDQYWIKYKKPFDSFEKSKPIKLLFIGTLNKNKNVEATLKACALLKQRKIQVTFDIVGSGNYEAKLKKMIKKLDIQDMIHFHGYIDEKAIIKNLMDECDIFVMPSVKETFGLVYIEAMSRGLPVIFSKSQAIDGYFTDGTIGYAVDPDNIELIVEKILKIYENYKEISTNCVLRSDSFNWDIISDMYLNLYNGKSVSNFIVKGENVH